LIAGNLKTPMPVTKLAEFIQVLCPQYPYRVSSYNVKEFLDVFGRNRDRSKDLAWSDIRKTLREQKSVMVTENEIFVCSALNPDSWVATSWQQVLKAAAIYHFIAVPIRISFLPWNTMLDTRALSTDLIADTITAVNILVCGNTAYKNSRAVWVTNGKKLLKKIEIGYIVAAIPFDWYNF
jgi:hypothetical protein